MTSPICVGVKVNVCDSKQPWTAVHFQDSMHWPEIVVDAGDFEKPHLIAGMPPDCIELTGYERVKQAFFPEIYKKYYDPKNPTHTFNSDVLL